MARERYLLDSKEEAIHNKSAEITLDTPKSKWNNFWFYHKTHVIVGIIIVALLVFFIRDLVNKVDPDYTIGIITSTGVVQTAVDDMQAKLVEYGEDFNGDGQVKVQVNVYTLDTSGYAAEGESLDTSSNAQNYNTVDPNIQMANMVKLSADFQTFESVVFLTDEACFQSYARQNVFAYNDGTVPLETATDYDNMRISMSEIPGFAQFEDPLMGMSNLSVSIRQFTGTAADDGKTKNQVYYEASMKLLDNLKTNTKVNPAASASSQASEG